MAIVAGPCVSEFGWELLEFQGRVRKQAQGIPGTDIYICSSTAMEPVYADMAPNYISHDIKGDRDCHHLREGASNPEEVIRVESILANLVQRLTNEKYKIIQLRPWTNHAVRYPLHEQVFVRYGIKGPSEYPIIIHARNRTPVTPFTGDNYPLTQWDELIGLIKKELGDIKIAAIGTRDAAFVPAGTMDLRGRSLQDVMNLMASAKLVVGPSSGPMHLASLCGTPHVVWCTSKLQPAIDSNNYQRYARDWNPFKTPVSVLTHQKWKVLDPADIAERVRLMWIDPMGDADAGHNDPTSDKRPVGTYQAVRSVADLIEYRRRTIASHRQRIKGWDNRVPKDRKPNK